MTTLRAHFDGKVLIPDEPVSLPQGRSLKIQVLDESPNEASARPAAPLLAVLQRPSRVSSEDVDALERSIDEGRLPVRFSNPFDDA